MKRATAERTLEDPRANDSPPATGLTPPEGGPPSPPRRAPTLLVSALALALLAVSLLGASIFATMPTNTISVSYGELSPYWRLFWPQGWAFFTKKAQSPISLIYKYEGSEWRLDNVGRNGELHHLLGLSRLPRARLIEFGFLQSFVGEELIPCEEEPSRCLAAFQREHGLLPLVNPTEGPLLCGPLGFVFQDPLPWAWRESRAETVMHSKVVAVSVDCNSASGSEAAWDEAFGVDEEERGAGDEESASRLGDGEGEESDAALDGSAERATDQGFTSTAAARGERPRAARSAEGEEPPAEQRPAEELQPAQEVSPIEEARPLGEEAR